ncbi:potassium channel family protein [uncultured Shewanella sp.]|uniref:potassium channel family protein n=1 Tax=uncultured Shewanella sp. TaxID=173975 RepID=UPI002634A5D5|nr:potassium channel family protein [uncultured Shewanella sp.]
MVETKRRILHKTETLTPMLLAMMLLSLLSVILVLTLAFAKLNPETRYLLFIIDTSICIIFLTHFFYGFFKSSNKKHYLKHHWVDLIASIPAVEAFRFARLFQILRVIRLIRITRSLLVPLVTQRHQTTLAGLLVAMVTILTLSSIFMLIVENGVPGANIITAEDAIWWAIVTISTVGYGDYFPITPLGHLIGALVIICGVSFFGVISGYIASILIAPSDHEQLEAYGNEMRNDFEDYCLRVEETQNKLLAEMSALRDIIEQQASSQSQSNKTP